MNVSKINIAIKNSLTLVLTLLIQDTIHIGVMNAVSLAAWQEDSGLKDW